MVRAARIEDGLVPIEISFRMVFQKSAKGKPWDVMAVEIPASVNILKLYGAASQCFNS